MNEQFAAFIPLTLGLSTIGALIYHFVSKARRHKAEITAAVGRQYPTSSEFKCPVCHSDNIIKASLVVAHGTKSTRTTTVGMGAAGGLGVGSAESHGVAQSAAAQSLSPPQPMQSGVALFAVVIGLLFLFNQAWVVGAVALLMGVVSLVRAYRYNRNTLPGLVKTWDELFLCQRCANLFKIAQRPIA